MPMKIAYVTTYDPQDVLNWSGLGHFIYQCLKDQGFDVETLGPLPPYPGLRRGWPKAKDLWYNRICHRRFGQYSPERDHAAARFLSESVKKKLTGRQFDLIFSPGTIPLAFLDTRTPIVTWTDATFHGIINSYPEYVSLTPDYYRDGESLERIALERASLCLYSSDWAAASAIRDYGIPASKVKVIPFGANVTDTLSDNEIRVAISRRNSETVRLLFVGVDFARKGGPKVLSVLENLRRIGVPAELEILGCLPEIPESLKKHVRVRGFVSKRDDEGRRIIEEAFLTSHWLILLPSAEAYGLVFAEANRYGVPCVAMQCGGIPTIIKNDLNGKLFEAEAPVEEIAHYIASTSRDHGRYSQMAESAYQEYKTRLNWRAAGAAFAACVQALRL
jgi:glycosyltransferase involved in cell wall biosynthesis